MAVKTREELLQARPPRPTGVSSQIGVQRGIAPPPRPPGQPAGPLTSSFQAPGGQPPQPPQPAAPPSLVSQLPGAAAARLQAQQQMAGQVPRTQITPGGGVVLNMAGDPEAGPGQPPGATPGQPRQPGEQPPAEGDEAYYAAAEAVLGPGRYSRAQLDAWREHYDPTGCPPSHPFHSAKEGGDNACVESPDNCPDGKQAWGTNQCISGDDPRITRAGGGVSGSGLGGGWIGGPGGPYGVGGPQADTIWQAILARLKGESRYTPEVMAQLIGATRGTAEAQARQRTAEAQEGYAARGMARSGLAAGAERAIRGDVYNQVAQANVQFQKAKIDADFQDKTAAIEEGISWLNSLRDYASRIYSTQAQREAAMANVQLGYATLQAQMDQLRERYAQQLQGLLLSGGG